MLRIIPDLLAVSRASSGRGIRLGGMPTFRYSIVYLFGLFAVLLADHYIQGVVAG